MDPSRQRRCLWIPRLHLKPWRLVVTVRRARRTWISRSTAVNRRATWSLAATCQRFISRRHPRACRSSWSLGWTSAPRRCSSCSTYVCVCGCRWCSALIPWRVWGAAHLMILVGLRAQFGFYETAGYGTFIYPVSPGRMDLEVCGMLLAPYSPDPLNRCCARRYQVYGLGTMSQETRSEFDAPSGWALLSWSFESVRRGHGLCRALYDLGRSASCGATASRTTSCRPT